ncbi:MAG: hypothetical protein ACFFG0_11995 [Candidatus Thorarchaeota archaeon]
MVQVLKKKKIEKICIQESYNLSEIKQALENQLYIPNILIKQKIISELLTYLEEKFSSPNYKIKPLISYYDSEVCGFVIVQIDPYYSSYSRKCGTFGWLHADSFDVCNKLMRECEIFIKENKIRKIRGNINFPKNLGGIGIQSMGFEEQMIYGVSYDDPYSQILNYLENLGFKKESEYTCVYVAQKSWYKGKKIDKDIEFRYLSIKELYKYADAIQNLAKSSFHEILPDASGRNRIFEFFEAFQKIPKSFYKIRDDFNPKIYSDVPQFIETWETYNLEKTEPFAPMAFDKKTGDLVGILLGLPDLFEAWADKPITRCNVDTAMIKKGYFGKGIFSALNNIGQLTCNLHGVDYFEGTGIWSNNSRAIDTIFPHCKPLRKHFVMQKRV